MSDPERWPLDFDALEKGSVISPEQMERAFRVERGTKEYNLRRMALRADIEKHFASLGTLVWVKMEGDSLTILTDQAAQPYLHDLFFQGLRRIGKVHLVNRGLDREALDDDAKRAHENSVILQSRIMQALRDERRKLKKDGFSLPQLPKPESEDLPAEEQAEGGE